MYANSNRGIYIGEKLRRGLPIRDNAEVRQLTSKPGKRAVYFQVSVQAYIRIYIRRSFGFITSALSTSVLLCVSLSVCVLSSVVMASRAARSLDSKPKLPELLNFKTASGESLKIITQIGTHYDTLGPPILEDDSGSVMDSIIRKNGNEPGLINQDILKRWLGGRGKKPVTWSTLIGLLKDIEELSELGEKIEADLTGSGEIILKGNCNANCMLGMMETFM